MLIFFLLTVSAPIPAWRIEIAGPEAALPGMATWQEVMVSETGTGSDEIRIMPGWPKKVQSNSTFSPCRGAALADFDGDGRLEVIVPSPAGQLHVWRADGSYYPGWPRTFSGMGQYAAAVGDIDRDGEYEIAICTRGMTSGGAVYVFAENGTVKAGWPFTGLVHGNFADSPTLADIDNDDTLEIIVGERDWPIGHLHVLRHNGVEQPGAWPCSLSHVPALGAAVGDINLDGEQEIVYASYNALYVLHPDGTALPGWPLTNPNGGSFSYQSPALADVDNDDTLEIVIAYHGSPSGTAIFRHDGTQVNGWPYTLPRWTYCPPTVADLYRNDDLKVLCGLSGIMSGAAAVLYGFDDDGSVLNGFPVVQPNGDAAEGNITVADVDGDGDMEILFTSNLMSTADTLGYLYAVHHDGTPVAGFPLRPYGWTYLNGATVADVDGDDSLDIVTVSYDNATTMAVTVWETGVPFNRMAWEWPTYQFDMARTGVYQKPTVGVSEEHRNKTVVQGFVPSCVRPGMNVRLVPAPEKEVGVTIYDRTGKVVTVLMMGPQGATVPPSLEPGVYFVRTAPLRRAAKLVVAR
ncbi:MAG: T9SS type A sorting domain-containing protein [candidate division WOR-3 bacterium]|nr:T9SS type A sorting domain-containing protein [candidate division WOR-3 bacterium]MCR4423885.1 T9SS type A sorting domain-containing protein [candidate division WOR-3 bacterium]MDH7519223.1 T9SS type A sorting domain-containing protein [bacterium]